MRRLIVIIMVAATALTLSACGGSSNAGEKVASDCKPIVNGVQTHTDGALTMAVAEYPPYVSLKGGTLSGVDGVLLTRVAKELCLKANASTQSFTAIIESVRNGSADLSAGNWYINEERGSQFELSKPVYQDKMAVLSASGTTSLADLAGKTVGTPQGYLWVKDLQAALGADKVKLYASEDAVYQDVAAGRIDAGITTFGGANQLVKANKSNLKVKVLEPDQRVQASVGAAQTAVLIHKGNTALQQAVNKVIEEMRADGSLKKALTDVGLPALAAEVKQP